MNAGDDVAAFLVTKAAGAKNDNVDNGATLCCRCRYGQRTVVMVFTRSTDGSVRKLVSELDAAVMKQVDEMLN